MKKIQLIIMLVSLISGSLFITGCTSLLNQQDLTFLSSIQEFQNESVNRISQINEDAKLKQWDKVKTDLNEYQSVIITEINHLNSLNVSEKVVPFREKAVLALQKQEIIVQSVNDLPELNESAIPDIAGDYLSGIINSAIASSLSKQE